MSWNIKEII